MAVAAITVIGLLLRLPSFGDSLYGDEVGAYWIVTGHSLGRVIYLMGGHSPELNPPLWFVFAWVSERVFGASAQSLKLVSLLAGTAAIPLTYLLGRWAVNVRTGLVASGLVAACPFLIFYSTEARPYALMLLLCLLSTLAVLKATRTKSRAWWAAYAVCSCAALYTHFTSVFVLAGLFLWAFVTQAHQRRELLGASALAAVGFAPWIPSLIRTAHSPGTKLYGVLDPLNLHSVRIDLGHWSFGQPYIPLSTLPGRLGEVLVLAGLAAAVVGGALITWRRRRERSVIALAPGVALVVVLAFAAPVGAALYSKVGSSVWGSRQVIASWPGFAVLLAIVLTYPRGAWRVAAVVLVVGAYVVGGVEMSETSNQRPDYQSAAAYIDHTSPAGAAVELTTVTPGPPTELEVALTLQGSASRHPVIRIGLPPLSAVLKAPPYTPLPLQSGQLIAREAVAQARTGTIFVVAPTDLKLSDIEATRRRHFHGFGGELALFASFLGSIPAQFHPVTSRTFDGFVPVSVYVYKR